MTAPVAASRTSDRTTSPQMGDLDFLDAVHSIYATSKAGWLRDEERYEGGDGVLDSLDIFKGEDAARYARRQAQASYLNFGRIHAQILAGHLARVTPMPSFGTMGEIRTREQIDMPTLAELVFWNASGVGNDGQQWNDFWTGALERACTSGHRWLYTEMPTLGDGARTTKADMLAGHRPYFIDYSPLQVPYWELTNGRLDWCVIRTAVGRSGVKDGKWAAAPDALGYYLLVRAGYQGLGDTFARGGWWLFDHEKTLESSGDWSRTKGQIPMCLLIASPSRGTTARPALSRSLTMELGQISISLMNRISERNYDAADAAKSVKFILGADKTGFNLIVDKLNEGVIVVPVVAAQNADGTVSTVVPQIYDSSAGAVASGVYSTIIDSTIAEAHEIMVRQITSTPDSSGASKAAGFSESTSPLLAGLAQRLETAMNTAIYFAELRAGAASPTGFVVIPKDVEILPLVAKVDATLARMKAIGASSPTLTASMLTAAAAEDSLLSDEDTEAVTAELVASLDLARVTAQATAMQLLTAAGAGSIGAVAEIAGMTPEQAKLLVEGSALDTADPTGGVQQ